MGEHQRGDVVLVQFPFTDFRATKLRPAVVLAVHGEDVVIAGIFSTIPDVLKATWLLIEERDPRFAHTGLKRRSVVKAEKLAIVHRAIIRSTIGAFDATLLASLGQLVKQALHLP